MKRTTDEISRGSGGRPPGRHSLELTGKELRS